MSRYYEFKCTNCGWIELRYSNSSRCRHCGMSIIRIEWPTADEQIMELRADLARLRELLGEVKDRVLVFGLYSPDLQYRIQSELKE